MTNRTKNIFRIATILQFFYVNSLLQTIITRLIFRLFFRYYHLMETKKLIDESNLYIMNTYKRFPIVMRKGRGMKVWRADGKHHTHFAGGLAWTILV